MPSQRISGGLNQQLMLRRALLLVSQYSKKTDCSSLIKTRLALKLQEQGLAEKLTIDFNIGNESLKIFQDNNIFIKTYNLTKADQLGDELIESLSKKDINQTNYIKFCLKLIKAKINDEFRKELNVMTNSFDNEKKEKINKLDDETKIPKYREAGVKAITKLTNVTGGTKISDSQSGLRAYNKKILEDLQLMETGMGISTEILIKANKKGLKIFEVPINISYEGETSTHNPATHGVSVIFSTMKFISLEHPLKFYGIPGIVFLTIGLFFIVWTLQEFTISRKIITNIALIAAGSTILGTVFMMTSIILYSVVSLIREKAD